MNWAYHLINAVDETEQMIAAPLMTAASQFLNPGFHFIRPAYQWTTDASGPAAYLQFKVYRLLYRWYWRSIESTLQNSSIDLIHAHFADVGCEVMFLAKKIGKPLCVSFYGNDYEKVPNTNVRLRRLYPQLFREADCFICEGEHGADSLKSRGCPAEKIRVIPLALPKIHQYPPRRKSENGLSLLQVAGFTEKKGHLYSLKAFCEALPTCPDLHLTIAGHMLQRRVYEEVEAFIATNQLSDRVTIMKAIRLDDLYDFMRNFDVFIHPSVHAADGDCEGGAPFVLLNAQTAGLPVISTRHCDIPGMVLHNRTGILTAERDKQGLAAAIRQFYHMSAMEYTGFSRAAQEHVLSTFDLEKSADDLRAAYEILCNS